MIVTVKEIHSIYKQLLTDENLSDETVSQPHVRKVLIFAKIDIDSLLSIKILVKLLLNDCMPYVLVPVEDMDDIREYLFIRENNKYVLHLENLVYIKAVFLIKCGGRTDLYEFFHLDSHTHNESHTHRWSDVIIYVFDNNRPIHLSNIFNIKNIFVIDDGELQMVLQEYHESFEYVNFKIGEVQESEESEILYEKHKSILDRYYTYSHIHDNCSGGVCKDSTISGYFYCLSESLQRNNNEILWHLIISMRANAFLYPFVSPESDVDKMDLDRLEDGCDISHLVAYREMLDNDYRLLKFEVMRFNNTNSDVCGVVENKVFNEEEYKYKYIESVGKIVIKDYLPLMLYNHWSLYESLYYSPIVQKALYLTNPRAYSAQGKYRMFCEMSDSIAQQLNTLLAKLGISLNESYGSYIDLDSKLKKSFKSKLKKEVGSLTKASNTMSSSCRCLYNEIRDEFEVVHNNFFSKEFYKIDSTNINNNMSSSDSAFVLNSLLNCRFQTHNIAYGSARSRDVKDILKVNFLNALNSSEIVRSKTGMDEGLNTERKHGDESLNNSARYCHEKPEYGVILTKMFYRHMHLLIQHILKNKSKTIRRLKDSFTLVILSLETTSSNLSLSQHQNTSLNDTNLQNIVNNTNKWSLLWANPNNLFILAHYLKEIYLRGSHSKGCKFKSKDLSHNTYLIIANKIDDGYIIIADPSVNSVYRNTDVLYFGRLFRTVIREMSRKHKTDKLYFDPSLENNYTWCPSEYLSDFLQILSHRLKEMSRNRDIGI